MASPEKHRHVFIIRIWCEPREIEGASPEWRGAIECVQNGERRYLKNLDEIAAFIAPYLKKMGVTVDLHWRIKRWLPWRT